MGSFQDFCFLFFFSRSNTDPGADKSTLWRTEEHRFISSDLIPSLMNNEEQKCDQNCAAMFFFPGGGEWGCIVFFLCCSLCRNTFCGNCALGRRLEKVPHDCKITFPIFSNNNLHLQYNLLPNAPEISFCFECKRYLWVRGEERGVPL